MTNMTMVERKERVAELVRRFKQDEKSYRASNFNEASTRLQFLDGFLEALGWDVKNEEEATQDSRSVKVEDEVPIDGGIKHTDYTLCLGEEKKIIVEAKKPSVRIKSDRAPAVQGRRYSRTLKLPVAIVTNFAEWAVYDARIKINAKDTAATARMEYLTCDQYVDHFEELYSHYSYEAVRKGRFKDWCNDTTDKHGTQDVDDEFLAMIERWREVLASDIARHNDIDGDVALTAAVQRIIDRIVFLRIAEGKAIEKFGLLREGASGEDVYQKIT